MYSILDKLMYKTYYHATTTLDVAEAAPYRAALIGCNTLCSAPFLPISSMLQYAMTIENILTDLLHIQFHCERTHTKTLLALTFSVRWVYSICALLAHLHTFAIRFLRRMSSKQTLFASNADETVTDADASSCKRRWQDVASKGSFCICKDISHSQRVRFTHGIFVHLLEVPFSLSPLPPSSRPIVVIRIVVWGLKTDRVTFTSRALLPSLYWSTWLSYLIKTLLGFFISDYYNHNGQDWGWKRREKLRKRMMEGEDRERKIEEKKSDGERKGENLQEGGRV